MKDYKIDVESKLGMDDNGRKFMETSNSLMRGFERRYLDHVETYFIKNLERTPLIVLALAVNDELNRRGIDLHT